MRGPTTPRGPLLLCGWLVAGSLALLSSLIPPMQLPAGQIDRSGGSLTALVDQAMYVEPSTCGGTIVRSVAVTVEPGAASGRPVVAGGCGARFVPV